MKTHYALLTIASLLLFSFPTANADPAVLYCDQDLGTFFVNGKTICSSQGLNETCEGAVIFVLTNDKCHAKDSAGCDGYQIFLASDNNCYGGPGSKGCEGTKVILPGSKDNCVGGSGTPGSVLLK